MFTRFTKNFIISLVEELNDIKNDIKNDNEELIDENEIKAMESSLKKMKMESSLNNDINLNENNSRINQINPINLINDNKFGGIDVQN